VRSALTRARACQVLVHDGKAGSGHYWAYILQRDGSWWKFSDAEAPPRAPRPAPRAPWHRAGARAAALIAAWARQVSAVAEEEVWRMSLGGHATTSAYCLMYRRAELEDSPPDFLPPAVQREVEEDTKRLQEEARAPPMDSPPAICLHGGIIDGAVLVKPFSSKVHAPLGAPSRRAHAVDAPAALADPGLGRAARHRGVFGRRPPAGHRG